MIIGLTGGIASGKTTVSKILKELGADIIDADKIAHQVLKRGEKGWERTVKYFGSDILTREGEIDRSYLGQIVFNNAEARIKLEEITHPLINSRIKEMMKRLKGKGKIIVLDAPLLFETGLDRLVNQVWVVYLDQTTQLKRLQKRDNLSVKKAEARIRAQMSLDEKCSLADLVIDNREGLIELKNNILKLWRDLR